MAVFSAIMMSAWFAGAQTHISYTVEQANTVLWKKFIDKYGIIHDFVGETPTPEDCVLGRPNAVGWWSPIENGPFFTGLYLSAACERARRSGDKIDDEKARRLADGLLKCASVSDVAGFIARGVGTDGQCHYPLGSVDQTIPWYLGLYSYLKSDIPTPQHRKIVMNKLREVTSALNALDWKLPCDGCFKSEFRGDLKSNNYLEVTSYLFLLRMMYQLFQDPIWLERYQTALFEYPRGSVEKPSELNKTRIDICAAGIRIDSVIFQNKHFDSQLWIYVKNQATIVYLAAMENDEKIKASYRIGIEQNVTNALEVIEAYKTFNNNDTKKFGHSNWREGYPTWFTQKTQSDAAKLASMGNKEKLGERKLYERTYMTNPLAAAAIIALAGDSVNREIVEHVISHYNYSKLNLSEFFLAEFAYYAFPYREISTHFAIENNK
ncbi:MAG: hypothetical protein GZ094_00985 [Mariniphaga sp.]|nr:hypothetical protein [Mariniphaga sp.]